VPIPAKQGLHGGGFGPHPRSEANGLSQPVGELLAPRCAEPQRRAPKKQETFAPTHQTISVSSKRPMHPEKPWLRIAEGLRATDLLLQGGGFSAIVLDLAGIAAGNALRVPMSHWHRYPHGCWHRTHGEGIANVNKKKKSSIAMRKFPK